MKIIVTKELAISPYPALLTDEQIISLAHDDPPAFFDGATWEIVRDDREQVILP